MSFGGKDWLQWVLEEDDALPLLEHAFKAGINTWDTISQPLVHGVATSSTNQRYSPLRLIFIQTASLKKLLPKRWQCTAFP